ncbi:YkuS family protein [Clostridium guangxiense]|uniref:YkuS family protein n=1 Tax=Clostridium guangxiense TaxID=1662055 RepID=UPI001E377C65|nr:YkuS family protein [Clostridium guangxiense]MCD2345673.1 YkuS family protein [Clostridium guangxiense]
MKKIGVEEGLSNIASYLKTEGYSVETLGPDIEGNVCKCKNLDAIITSDRNTDMMGISDTSTKIPVINASGLTQEEVKNMIQQKTTR